jgi:hypothetical protein
MNSLRHFEARQLETVLQEVADFLSIEAATEGNLSLVHAGWCNASGFGLYALRQT